MTEQNQQGTAGRAADPAAFDFHAYISGAATFPEFEHRVFLDQRSGAELHELRTEYDKLAKRRSEILSTQERMADAPTRSLVDEEAEALSAELAENEKQLTAMEPKIDRLIQKVNNTALLLKFRAGTAQKLGQVVRQAEKEFHKKHGRKDDTDIEYITAKSKSILAAQLKAYCYEIVLADGTEQEPPDEQGFLLLLDSMISSESVRLMTTLNTKLDSSADWAEKIDAGFPGGRDEPGPEPVAGASAEDSPLLVAASADAVEGG